MEDTKSNNALPGLFLGNRNWIKFSDYEIIKASKRNEYYIIPKQSSEIEYYFPMNNPQKVIYDFIKMVKEIYDLKYSKDLANNNVSLNYKAIGEEIVLPFVKEYGLFGLFRKSAHIQIGKVFIKKEFPFVNLRMMTIASSSQECKYDDYIAQYFPINKAPYPVVEADPELFWNGYAESVEDIVRVLLNFAEKNNMWGSINQLDESINHTNRPISNDIALYPEYDEKDNCIKLVWGFRTLYDALLIMYINDIASKDRKVFQCVVCGGVMLYKPNRVGICSGVCRQKYVDMKSGERKKRLRERWRKEAMWFMLEAEKRGGKIIYNKETNKFSSAVIFADEDLKLKFNKCSKVKEFKEQMKSVIKNKKSRKI